METVKTATGRSFPCDACSMIETPLRLYIRIAETPLATVAQVFGDPAETVQLWCAGRYFAMFTKLLNIRPENGAVRVTLTKG